MTGYVNLVGCGPGGSEWVLPAARHAVVASDMVFGPPDLQALFPEATGPRVALPARPESAAPLVYAAFARGLMCAVLVRGDCGLHSLSRGLQARLPAGSCRRIPGLSSVQVACAAFGLDWENARVLSAHGRSPGEIDAAARAATVVVVLGGGALFAPLLEGLRDDLGSRRLLLASDLTLPAQRLLEVPPHDRVPPDLPSRTIALFPRSDTP